MNDRIKQLEKQASDYYWSLDDDVRTADAFTLKFAELIVQNCIDIVRPTSHHEAWAQSYMGGVDGLDLLHGKIKDIKEHFGVEL